MAEKTMALKLLIDTKVNRVLYADAGKEVVDFIFGLLALPLGSIVKVLGQEQMIGSIASIYSSLKTLDSSYMHPDLNKDILLNPNVQRHCQNNVFLLPAPPPAKVVGRCYSCSCFKYASEVYGRSCPLCNGITVNEMRFQERESEQALKRNQVAGYVKDMVTYALMDDLSVMPISSISIITLLDKFSIEDVNVVKEQTVKVGMKEAVELLKASFNSKTVLTDVFLASKV